MTVKETQTLKQLNTTKAKLEAKVKRLEEESKFAQREFCTARNQLEAVIKQIDNLKNDNVIVTEHAILRYLERKFNLNLDEIRKEILSEQTKSLVKTLGNGKFPIGDGLHAVVKDNSVVTVA